jgi:F420-dependent oxidoreductase-like protein
VRVGLQLASFTWPGGAPEIARRLADIGHAAEEAGFHSLWVMDHYFQIPPWGKPEEHPMLEAYATLGYLAAATERIRLGVLVSGVVYRPPAVLIKAATTVDVLSRGRTYFGIGAAWFKEEADALGIAFPALRERYALLEDTLRLARQTWSGDTRPFSGNRVRASYPLSNPRPLSSPRPKILVGGDGPKRTLPLVARYADAWNVITSPSRLDVHRDRLRAECERIGRAFGEIEVTALDPEDVRRDDDAGYRWTPRWEVERLRQWPRRGPRHREHRRRPYEAPLLRTGGNRGGRLKQGTMRAWTRRSSWPALARTAAPPRTTSRRVARRCSGSIASRAGTPSARRAGSRGSSGSPITSIRITYRSSAARGISGETSSVRAANAC